MSNWDTRKGIDILACCIRCISLPDDACRVITVVVNTRRDVELVLHGRSTHDVVCLCDCQHRSQFTEDTLTYVDSEDLRVC